MSSLSDKNRQKAEERILKAVTVKCKKCNGKMVRVIDWNSYSTTTDLGDETIVGYSCQDCSHYYLFH
jgi:hypothetical protein